MLHWIFDLCLATVVGLTAYLGGRLSLRPVLRSYQDEVERYRALDAIAGSLQEFLVTTRQSPKGCPVCGSTGNVSYTKCRGRCSRAENLHVHVKCGNCDVERVHLP